MRARRVPARTGATTPAAVTHRFAAIRCDDVAHALHIDHTLDRRHIARAGAGGVRLREAGHEPRGGVVEARLVDGTRPCRRLRVTEEFAQRPGGGRGELVSDAHRLLPASGSVALTFAMQARRRSLRTTPARRPTGRRRS